MITTGTNFPFVDFISLILSTKSAGKLVQILGRGTRNYPGKRDCLIADHGKNLAYHGPIDQIRPKEPGSGEGEQPKKVCPTEETGGKQDENGNWGCGEAIPISFMTCHCCGYIFPPNEEEKITAEAAEAPVLSTEKPWHTVSLRTFRHHPGKGLDKDGNPKPDSIKVTYMVGMKAVNEWKSPESSVASKGHCDRWWFKHGGKRPGPKDWKEWLERQDELLPTAEVQLSYARNPKYPDVKDFRVGSRQDPANDNQPEPSTWARDMDDFIPF